MQKSLPLLLLFFVTAACGGPRYTVEISLDSGHPSQQVSATVAALEKRLGQVGTVKELRLEENGPLKITFTSGLEPNQLRQLLEMPGKFGFSEVYTLDELDVFTDTFEEFFQADRNYPDPGTESLLRSIIPSWGGPDTYIYNPVIAYIQAHETDQVKESFGKAFWRQIIPRDGVPALKTSRQGPDYYELIILRAGNNDPWNDHVVSAKSRMSDYGEPEISVVLDKTGAGKFAEITRANIHRSLAIVIDGKIVSVPMVRSEVDGGRVSISGFDDPDNAVVLSAALSGGTLEVPVTVVSLTLHQ